MALESPSTCTCLGTVTAVDPTGRLALQVIFRQCRVDVLVTASKSERLPCAVQSVTDLAVLSPLLCAANMRVKSHHDPSFADEVKYNKEMVGKQSCLLPDFCLPQSLLRFNSDAFPGPALSSDSINIFLQVDIVTHICSSGTWEAEKE